MAQFINKVGYGLSEALPNLAPMPIQARRVPTTADKGYLLGQLWINKATNAAYILTAVVANVATWVNIAVAAGAAFTTLTSTGATTLATTGASVNTFGNTTGATSLALRVGTGNFLLDGAPTSTLTFGTSLTSGTITIGGTAQTGTITLGSSTGIQTVAIGAGSTASKTVSIASGTAGNTVSINDGINTVANGNSINDCSTRTHINGMGISTSRQIQG